MTESFAEYRRRVLGYLGPRDPMRVLASTPRRLVGAIAGQRRPALARSPAPGKGSTFVHDKRGRQSVREFVVMEAAHDLNHLLQIHGLLQRKTHGL
jgi:hypothetical protein